VLLRSAIGLRYRQQSGGGNPAAAAIGGIFRMKITRIVHEVSRDILQIAGEIL